ncbi:MAG: hypothetical protein Q8O34_00730 [Rhodocyclaceae bacterium]|nr:hypothetical protein [Rhodocyclaceae bacterium]
MRGYFRHVLIAVDQLANAALGGAADETLSARAYREDWMIQHLINLLFWDRHHCASAYNSEMYGLHLPEEYRNLNP